MIVVAAFESPAVIAGLDDVTVMGQAVEQRSRHLGVAEHTGPFSEREIGGDDDGGALVEPADEMEQKLAAGLGIAAPAGYFEAAQASNSEPGHIRYLVGEFYAPTA